jgi:hypothetical protein
MKLPPDILRTGVLRIDWSGFSRILECHRKAWHLLCHRRELDGLHRSPHLRLVRSTLASTLGKQHLMRGSTDRPTILTDMESRSRASSAPYRSARKRMAHPRSCQGECSASTPTPAGMKIAASRSSKPRSIPRTPPRHHQPSKASVRSPGHLAGQDRRRLARSPQRREDHQGQQDQQQTVRAPRSPRRRPRS